MLGYVFTSSLKDFLRPGRLAVWVVLALVIGLMGRLWISLGAPGNPQETYGQLSSVIVYRFMALVAAIFSTMVVSQEVEGKTIVYMLTRTVPRSTMLLGRTLACVAAVTLISWVGEFVWGDRRDGVAGFCGSGMVDRPGDFGFGGGDLFDLFCVD